MAVAIRAVMPIRADYTLACICSNQRATWASPCAQKYELSVSYDIHEL